MKLAPNFTYQEAVHSQTATRHRIDNTPNQKQFRNMVYTAMIMQQVRNYFGNPIHVSSFFRCLEVNRLIGSKDTSSHIQGRACDFVIHGVDNNTAFELLKESGIPFKKLINEFPDSGTGWLHMEVAEFALEADKSFLLAVDDNGTTKYLRA